MPAVKDLPEPPDSPDNGAAVTLLRHALARLDPDHRPLGEALLGAFATLDTVARRRIAMPTIARTFGHIVRVEPAMAVPLERMLQAFDRLGKAAPGVLFQRWSDLHNHLRFAYVPAGRVLQERHGESASAAASLDAFLSAAGLTAMLQEAPRYHETRQLVVLPAQWLGPLAGGSTAPRLNADELKAAYAIGLARLDELLAIAERGAPALANAGLRSAVRAGCFLMRRLRRRMLRRTPFARTVGINAVDRFLLRWRR